MLEGLSNPHGASGQMRSLFVALVFVVLSAAVTPAKECTVGQYEADKEDMIAATKAGTLKADPASGSDGITLKFLSRKLFGIARLSLRKLILLNRWSVQPPGLVRESWCCISVRT